MIQTSEGVVDIESKLVRVLLFASVNVKGLVSSNGPVFVHLMGKFSLRVNSSIELKHVVKGSLVGKLVLATGGDMHGLLSQSLFSFFIGVVVELVSVNELMLGVFNHATSVKLLVHIGTEEVLVAFIGSHDHNFSISQFFFELDFGTDKVVLLDVKSKADADLGVLHYPFLFLELELLLKTDVHDNIGAGHVGRFNAKINVDFVRNCGLTFVSDGAVDLPVFFDEGHGNLDRALVVGGSNIGLDVVVLPSELGGVLLLNGVLVILGPFLLSGPVVGNADTGFGGSLEVEVPQFESLVFGDVLDSA